MIFSRENNLIDDLFKRKYRKVGQEKSALGFFFSSVFFASILRCQERGLNIASFTICQVVSHVCFEVSNNPYNQCLILTNFPFVFSSYQIVDS